MQDNADEAHHPHPAAQILDSILELATSPPFVPSRNPSPVPMPPSVEPIVQIDLQDDDLDFDDDPVTIVDSQQSRPTPVQSSLLDDQPITILEDSRDLPEPEPQAHNDDIQIVSTACVPPRRRQNATPANADIVLVLDSTPTPSPPPPAVIDVESIPVDVVLCNSPPPAPSATVDAPPKRNRPHQKCDSCSERIPDEPALLISRCKHHLCPQCALRCVANVKDVPRAIATDLHALPVCIVKRCRAPLNRQESETAIASAVADAAFEPALVSFHEWHNAELPDPTEMTGPSNICFPTFTAEMYDLLTSLSGSPNDPQWLVTDDLSSACAPLWIWDSEYRKGSQDGAWICMACGIYDGIVPSDEMGLQGAKNFVSNRVSPEIDGFMNFSEAPANPGYPHCANGRALAVLETIRGLGEVGEEKDEAASIMKEGAGASGVNTRSTRKRYKTASSIRSAKRRKVTGFAKGTGYAGKSGAEWKGTSNKLLEETAKKDTESAFWLSRLRCFILRTSEAPTTSWPGFMRVLLRECDLIPHLAKILINESIMDVLERIPVFIAALRVVHALAESPSLRTLVTEPSDGDHGRSIAHLIESLSKQAAFLSTGAGHESLPEPTSLLIKQIRRCIRVINRHGLLVMARNKSAAVCAVDVDGGAQAGSKAAENSVEAQPASDEAEPAADSGKAPFDADKAAYIEQMRAHQFMAMPGIAVTSSFFGEAQMTSSLGVGQGKRQRRIASEVASLFSSLPLSWSSSILLRVDEDRYDFLRACIFGPEDTPYDSGAFIFDIYLPNEYPSVPPKFRLLTTGGGKVRFNPNLYNNGKVCLSLLGTWSGPSWTAASTILQVLVSIQSLILVSDPYFNEPGYERQLGTPRGNRDSAHYNAKVRFNTACYAIQANIRHPCPDLQEGILAHFRLKQRYLLQKMRIWFPPKSEATQPENTARTVTSAQGAVGSNSAMALPSVAQILGGGGASAGPMSATMTQGSIMSNLANAIFPSSAVFGHNRTLQSHQMSKTNLDSIIRDLESLCP